MLSLVNGLQDSFLDEVGGLLLDSSNGLGSALLDDLSFGDGSLGLGFLLIKSLLCNVLQVRDGVLGLSLDSGYRCFGSCVGSSNSDLGSLGRGFLGLDELSNGMD